MGLDPKSVENFLPAELKDKEQLAAARDELARMHAMAAQTNAEIAQAIAHERDKFDLRTAMAGLKERLPDLGMSHETLLAVLSGFHETDQRIADGWNNRYKSPAGWRHQLERIAGKLYSDFVSRPIDQDATDTKFAVAAAVRGASGRREPAPVNYNAMTDRQFADHLKSEYGFTPRLD
jgi:hypothetical protein